MAMLPPVVEEPKGWNQNPVFYWNAVALDLNRLTHSLSGVQNGPQTGPPISARALAIVHVAIHDAVASLLPQAVWHLVPFLDLVAGAQATFELRLAIAGAANAVLRSLYGPAVGEHAEIPQSTFDALDALIERALVKVTTSAERGGDSFRYGQAVGEAAVETLGIQPNEPGASQLGYQPRAGQYRFRDDPTNPVRLVPAYPGAPDGETVPRRIYHAPFYGVTAHPLAIRRRHEIADPPTQASAAPLNNAYLQALADVYALGGAVGLNTTTRTPDQMTTGYFWAYDGSNLIGTPPRHYNQILRGIAWEKRPDTAAGTTGSTKNVADAARLFALVNVAMADAGIEAWRHKWCYEFWRPLSGVREHEPHRSNPADGTVGPTAAPPPPANGAIDLEPGADPFWRTLGAPNTNLDDISFKPPFPAYPSGHATFGGAAFQMMRLYYRKRDNGTFAITPFVAGNHAPTVQACRDGIGFISVSDELNGVSRDLRQPYRADRPITDQPGNVRTRVVRKFDSLWDAMFDNADSRVYLGVHWRFDSYGFKLTNGKLVLDTNLRGPRKGSSGTYPLGGVPLGMAIAEDVFANFTHTPLGPLVPPLENCPPDAGGGPVHPAPTPTPAQAAAERFRLGASLLRVPVKIESTNIR